jgi:hypothetical protein
MNLNKIALIKISIFLLIFPTCINNINYNQIQTNSIKILSTNNPQNTIKSTYTNINNRYKAAGINDSSEFESSFNYFKVLVAKDNKIELAKYIWYPIDVRINGKKTLISSEEEFILNYDKIITPRVKMAVINQQIQNSYVYSSGVMIGQGELWFTEVSTSTNNYLIYAINN